jgi:glycine cleavage system H protein
VRVAGYEFPADRWYEPREHLWIQRGRDGAEGLVTIGLDAVAQEALGEVVYVQLVEPGLVLARRDALGSLEAEKMVRPLLAPVSGAVGDVNRAVLGNPRLVNADPYGAGWLVRLRATRWEAEQAELLWGTGPVTAWIEAEVRADRERG